MPILINSLNWWNHWCSQILIHSSILHHGSLISDNNLVLNGLVNNILSLLELLLSILSCSFADDVGIGALKNGLGCLRNIGSLVLTCIHNLESLLFQWFFIIIVNFAKDFDGFFSIFFSCGHSSSLDRILCLVYRFQIVKLLLLGLLLLFYLLSLILGVVLSQHLLEWLIKEVFFGCFGLNFRFNFCLDFSLYFSLNLGLNFSFNLSFNLGFNLSLNFGTVNWF